MLDVLFVVLGLAMLIFGGNYLLKGAVDVSYRLVIPKMVVGLTVVSFITSAPELIVSLQSALRGYPDLAVGNVVGSNIANLGLVLGITLLIGYMDVQRSFFITDWPVMMAASVLFIVFVFYDGFLGPWEGITMVMALSLFLVYLLRFQKGTSTDHVPEVNEFLPLYKTVLFLVLGGAALWAGSEVFISGVVGLAKQLEVSERVIGITLVSVGTSIPELAASIIAMVRREKAISVGNILGSNIFNLLAVLGITAMAHPIQVIDERLFQYDVFWMLGISFLLLPLAFFPRGKRLAWKDGLVLLGVYSVFLYTTFN